MMPQAPTPTNCIDVLTKRTTLEQVKALPKHCAEALKLSLRRVLWYFVYAQSTHDSLICSQQCLRLAILRPPALRRDWHSYDAGLVRLVMDSGAVASNREIWRIVRTHLRTVKKNLRGAFEIS
jgi:hypothetical protein